MIAKEGLLGLLCWQGLRQGQMPLSQVPLASHWPDPALGFSLPSRRRSVIPSSCWSSWQPQVLPAVLVAPVVPQGAAEWQVVPPHRWKPAGQEDLASVTSST